MPMTEMATAIMDAAELRIRHGGFSGFSFRDLAADVGVKSSSVHYHFPTKEDLTAAVIHRYTDFVAKVIDEGLAKDPDPVKVWTTALGSTVHSDDRMCPATVLGAARHDLPPRVGAEVERFFKMHEDKLVAAGLERGKAAELLATTIGAMVVSSALGDPSFFDRAAAAFARELESTSA
jgi:TetR/AcrR family transcriptional regulator, transcriptional repressor for nem operon